MKMLWKYFLILLAASLLPLLVVAGLSQYGVLELGASVSQEAGDAMTRVLTEELVQSAKHSAAAVDRDGRALEFALRYLAQQTEEALLTPGRQPKKLYFSKDFDEEKTAPEDTEDAANYYVIDEAGHKLALPVSFDHPVCVPAPNVPGPVLRRDSARLCGLTPIFRQIYEDLGGVAYRMYIILESGAAVAYPGFGGYPERFDPRRTLSYVKTRESGDEPFWSPPFVSKSSWRMFFSVSLPLRDAGGRFLGMAAIDVPLSWFLRQSELAGQWTGRMRSFLVYPEKNQETGAEGLRVMAKKGYQDESRSLIGKELEWLTGPDAPAFRDLVDDIRQGRTGAASMPYKGEDSIWAYARESGNLSFVLIVPKAVAMTVPDELRQDVHELIRSQMVATVLIVVVVVAVAALVAWFGARAETRPIMAMVGAWNRLAEGDFTARLDITTRDERDRLVESFNTTVPKLENHVQMSHALALAQEVQQSLLPQAPPEVHGFELAGEILYCDETGGDYLDFYEVLGPGNRFAVVVGDVSGHGVASALFMATARAMFRALSLTSRPLTERVAMVNRLLAADVYRTSSFMTLYCLEVDADAGAMRWVRAGHDPAYLYHPDTGEFEELMGRGIALGMMDDSAYEFYEKEFNTPGMLLLVGTDGIWELPNADKEMFGKERFFAVVRRNADKSAGEILAAVFDALSRFRGGATRQDDITLAVVKKT